MSADEQIEVKQEWYDLNKYKDEIQLYVSKKRKDLDVIGRMEMSYDYFYKSVYAGSEEADTERFAHAAEMFKTYKSAIIQSSLGGYSALLEPTGEDAYSVLRVPELKKVMTQQFKDMALLEKLSSDVVDDWIFKGEAVGFIKLKETNEQFRVKETVSNGVDGEPIMQFKMVQGVTFQDLDVERIDPLDFYVDGIDYEKDPSGCAKIIRSWIDSKTLLTSKDYPLLTKQDKDAIVESVGRNGRNSWGFDFNFAAQRMSYSKTDKDRIEVLSYYGDYITSDNKVLKNIVAVVINNRIASLKYSGVSTNRIIYAAYKLDRQSHRGISPLSSTRPVNNLINKVCDMFVKNLEDICNPWLIYQKGTITPNQMRNVYDKKQLEYNAATDIPQFWAPPQAAQSGLQIVQTVIEQSKNVLGLNNYLTGDTSGSVRTAEESAILFQNANARMRVETDVFSYKFMLNLFNAFYQFNRELALAYDNALNPIYADPNLKVSISTNASKADKEGELQRLMSMLNLPIAQMIFSNLTPEQTVLAVRYLMAKADLTDADNLLELIDEQGNTQVPTDIDEGTDTSSNVNETQQSEQM